MTLCLKFYIEEIMFPEKFVFRFLTHKTNAFWPDPTNVDSFWKTMTSKPAIKDRLESNLEYLLEKDYRGLKEWDMKLKIIQENFLKVKFSDETP